MQFTGTKGIALFVAIIAIVCMTGFGTGLLIGRQFPAHHFEKMENSHYLYDTSTGHVCDFWPANAEVSEASGQVDQAQAYFDSLKKGSAIPPCNH